jgi:hypothetical protein
MQQSPLAGYMPYRTQTEGLLTELAELHPRTLGTMNGVFYSGDGHRVLNNLAAAMHEVFKSACPPVPNDESTSEPLLLPLPAYPP